MLAVAWGVQQFGKELQVYARLDEKNNKMVMMKKIAQMVEKRKDGSKNLKGTSCWTVKIKVRDSERTI